MNTSSGICKLSWVCYLCCMPVKGCLTWWWIGNLRGLMIYIIFILIIPCFEGFLIWPIKWGKRCSKSVLFGRWCWRFWTGWISAFVLTQWCDQQQQVRSTSCCLNISHIKSCVWSLWELLDYSGTTIWLDSKTNSPLKVLRSHTGRVRGGMYMLFHIISISSLA